MKHILVTGGSGFIGSAVVDELLYYGYTVTVLDRVINEWTKKLDVEILNFDINKFGLHTYYKKFDAIIHMAASHVVPESVADPLKYYKNNLLSMMRLIEYAKDNDTKIVFSSSAAVYDTCGNSIDESYETIPHNPYGQTKLWSEQMLNSMFHAHGVSSVSLRYFNVAGAGKKHGYNAKKPTHAVPILLKSVLNNIPFRVFGNDYPTKDGTCVRDYLHVTDVARAHVQALHYLESHKCAEVFNLGTGTGTSMLDLIAGAERVLDKQINFEYDKRRMGDPPFLVANAEKAEQLLGWIPKKTLEQIILDSWNWETNGLCNRNPELSPRKNAA